MSFETIFWICWAAGMAFCLVMALYCNWMGTRPISDE